MPHYADGTEAKVGDQVAGKLYNSGPEPKAGVIISITPGAESCNAQVQFVEAKPIVDGVMPEAPRMCLHGKGAPSDSHAPFARTVQGEQHGSSGPLFVIFQCADYCATNELTKVG